MKAEPWQREPEGVPMYDFCEGAGCRRQMECARYLYLPLRPAGHGRIHGHMCPDLSMNLADPKLHWTPVEEHSRDILLALTPETEEKKCKPVPKNKLDSATVEQIIQMKEAGQSNKAIAQELMIGLTTLKRYWAAYRTGNPPKY